MLIIAISTEMLAKIVIINPLLPICSKAPKIIIPDIALVIAIKGVCNEWLTFQITWKPIKQDKTNTIKCCIKEAGA